MDIIRNLDNIKNIKNLDNIKDIKNIGPMKKAFHWVPDLPDYRDYHVEFVNESEILPQWIPHQLNKRGIFKIAASALPEVVDLRKYCSPIKDQGTTLGSCVGNALVSYLEYFENKNNRRIFSSLSRLFVYYNSRWIENDINEDSGAEIRDGVKALAKWGACHEKLFPYVENEYTTHPSNAAYLDAMKNRIRVYARVEQNINSIKTCLSNGYPIVFGLTIFDSFSDIGNTGTLRMPQKNESSLGGHCVLGLGFDDTKQVIIAQNSWGSDWGDNGFFYMPYKYIINKGLADDFWVISE